MKINRDNYEEFFLDFAEGNLSVKEEEILNNFLRFNPDLAEELKDFDLLKISADSVKFPIKDSLRKGMPTPLESVNQFNFEMFSIAYLEDDLTGYQRELFEAFLKLNSEYSAGFTLLKRTYSEAETIPFPYKSKLIKGRRTSIFNLKVFIPVAAAAAIALLVLIRMEPIEIENEIASLPEAVIATETHELEPEDKKPLVQERAATIQIIRTSRTSVPVSNIKKQNPSNTKESMSKGDQTAQNRQKMAGINILKTRIPELKVKNDQITNQPLPLPTIHMSSLAVAERVRYQLDRASGLLDEDDVFIWNLANQGIQEINKRTGTEMSLLASKNQDGSVSGFQFKSRFFNVTSPLSPRDE